MTSGFIHQVCVCVIFCAHFLVSFVRKSVCRLCACFLRSVVPQAFHETLETAKESKLSDRSRLSPLFVGLCIHPYVHVSSHNLFLCLCLCLCLCLSVPLGLFVFRACSPRVPVENVAFPLCVWCPRPPPQCFHGHGGRAFLFERCVNVSTGRPEDRLLLTGMHVVADISCKLCGAELGWKYVSLACPPASWYFVCITMLLKRCRQA